MSTSLPKAVRRAIGGVSRAQSVGRSQTTWRVTRQRKATIFVKCLSHDRATAAAIHRSAVASPPLLKLMEVDGRLYAMYAALPGRRPVLNSEGLLEQLSQLAQRLTAAKFGVELADLRQRWWGRVVVTTGEAPERLLEWMTLRHPREPVVLSHGDLAPQNLRWVRGQLYLLDWEETGVAPPGFDLGWCLAQNRLGAGFRYPRAALQDALRPDRLSAHSVLWFEGLALLRMRKRLSVWLSDPLQREIGQTFLDGAITELSEEIARSGPW